MPSASNNFPIAEKERFKPTLSVTPSGKKLLDFGQNIAGYAEFEITARKGQKIILEFGELLRDGELTLENIQCKNKHKTTPLQRVEYICKEGVNRYKTKFAIFGFQYISVETDVIVRPEDFTAIAVYSDMEETGFFNSSNELLNKFVEVTKWSAKGNSTDLPTDCRPESATAGRATHRYSAKPRAIFSTTPRLRKSTCAICATSSSKTETSARYPRAAAWTSI